MTRQPRVLKLPKFGGSVLPILPILSGLSAIGSIAASTTGIVKALNEMKAVRKQVEEGKNHQEEKKIGHNLNLTYKRSVNGYGFYLKPFHQQQQQQR